MSATLIRPLVVAHLTSVFAADRKADRPDVVEYAGEFNAEEINFNGYNCPTIFVAVRGWRPQPHGRRLVGPHVRAVEITAFVVTKNSQRNKRMASAELLAERVALALDLWQPDTADNILFDLAPMEDDAATCENLYSRAVDKAGQAMWGVHWTQCMNVRSAQHLFDLLTIEAQQQVRTTEPAPTAAPVDLVGVAIDTVFKTTTP